MVLLPLILCTIFGIASGALFAFLPPFAKEAGLLRIGIFYFLYSASAIGVRLFGIRLADRWERWKVLVPAFLLEAAGIFLLLWSDPLTAISWAGVLTGGAHGLLFPTLSALLVDQVEPGHRGRVLGLFSGAIILGTSVGAIGMGQVAHLVGYHRMFSLTGLFPLLGVLLIVFRRDTKVKKP
jgi:predicted MFS family arabinose efflux permease